MVVVVVDGGAVVVGGGNEEVARCACCVWLDGCRVGVRGSTTEATMRTSSVADIAPRLWRRGRATRGYGHAYSNHAIYWTRLSRDTLVGFRACGYGQGKDGCARGQDGWWWLSGARRDVSGQYVRSVHGARRRFSGDMCVPMESCVTHPRASTVNEDVGYRYTHVRYAHQS